MQMKAVWSPCIIKYSISVPEVYIGIKGVLFQIQELIYLTAFKVDKLWEDSFHPL